MLNWKFPHRDILTECRRLPRSTISSIEKAPRKVEQNPVEKAQQLVVAVAAVENTPVPVERLRKFHCSQTFIGDVVKAGIKRGNSCKAEGAVCRNCPIKGHYKESMHDKENLHFC